jgi:iron complex outermembrane recepter protein
MHFHPSRRTKLAFAISLVLNTSAFAQSNADKAGVQQLDAITVNAAPSPVDKDNPSPKEGFSREDLGNMNVVNTEDAVRYAPNTLVRKRYIGDRNATLSGRSNSSLQSARGLVYADGVLLSNFLGNNFGFAPRWNIIAPEELNQVDVVYGPYSALYPGNSLGTTVWLTTREPQKFEASARVQTFTQPFEEYGYKDHFSGRQISAWMGSKQGPISYTVSANALDSNGHPQGFATPNTAFSAGAGAAVPVTGAIADIDPNGNPRLILGPTSIEKMRQEQGKFKIGYYLTPQTHLSAFVSYWQNHYSRRAETFLRDASGNPVYGGNITVNGSNYTVANNTFSPMQGEDATALTAVTLKHRLDNGWQTQAIVSWYENLRERQRTSSARPPAAESGGAGQFFKGDGTGWRTFDVKAEGKLGNNHSLTFGYHFDRYILENETYSTPNWIAANSLTLTSAFFGKSDTHGVYAQDAWRFAENWTATLGVRVEEWKAYDGSLGNATNTLRYGERSEDAISPKASLKWRMNDTVTWRLSAGQATRFPTVTELFQGTISGTNIVNNDPNLKPERALGKDLSAEINAFDGVVRIAVFEDIIKDVLVRQTDSTVNPSITNIQNIERMRARGVEASYSAIGLFEGRFDLLTSVAFNRSKTLENSRSPASIGKEFPRIPRLRAALVATYHFTPDWSATLAVHRSPVQYAGEHRRKSERFWWHKQDQTAGFEGELETRQALDGIVGRGQPDE